MNDFYVPSRKEELVKFLRKKYPSGFIIDGKSVDWSKLPKKRLYAIYFALRRYDK